MTRMRHCLARVALQLKMGDTVYQLPREYNSVFSKVVGYEYTADFQNVQGQFRST